MTTSKNNRNKARKRLKKHNDAIAGFRVEVKKRQASKQVRDFLTSQALVKPKVKKSNKGLVRKFKDLFKRKVK